MFEFDWVQHIRMAFAKSKAKLLFLSLHGVEYNIKSISPVREKGKEKGIHLKLIDYIMLSLDR